MTMREIIDMIDVDMREMRPDQLRALVDAIDIDRIKPETLRRLLLALTPVKNIKKTKAELRAMSAQYGDDEMDQLETEKISAQILKTRAEIQAILQRAGIRRDS